MTDSARPADATPDQIPAPAAPAPSGLQAIWANTAQPVAPLPWYRRVSRRALVTGAVAVGLLTVLAVGMASIDGGPAPRKALTLPDTLGTSVRLPDDPLVESTRADYPVRTLRPRFKESAVARYGAAGSTNTELIVIGLSGAADPKGEAARFFARADRGSVMQQTVTDLEDYPAGPLGGDLQCAQLTYSVGSETACVWSGADVVGIVVDKTGKSTPEALAARTVDIRAAAEPGR
ncbi:hypothetical protein [Kitasatospora sp. NPDC101183]|uniref:hypothetical protein n=1 Tax=Kitasatospora sp. NPDC101183 TaxID=3364100 RepID=UPI0037F974C0